MSSTTLDLNSVMEFDHVITVHDDGSVTDAPAGIYAPELYMSTDDDGQILPEHEEDFIGQARGQGWELISGWTGQYGYHGVVMHASEYVGGGLADYIRATPGMFVCIVVNTLDDDEPAGWTIAYRYAD